MSDTVIVIPSRIGSVRLAKKPLIDIDGKPMIIHVANMAQKAAAGEVLIACDSKEVAELAQKHNINFVMTDPGIRTGSDRVYNAVNLIEKKYQYIVNLQGDMPAILPSTIRSTVDALKNHQEYDIMTAITTFLNEDERNNISNVKAIVAHKDTNKIVTGGVAAALYFTRTSNLYTEVTYKHIGLYGFKANSLEKYNSLPQTLLESKEKLEQLRALENGMKVGCAMVEDHVISIDTMEDLILYNNRRNSIQ